VGVVLDSLLTGSARRAAQSDEAGALQIEAVELAAQAAWQVRQRVRGAYRELYAAIERREQAAAVLQTRQALRAAQQSRLERGAADARELLQARQAEAEAALQFAQARDTELRARLALASAVGVPGDTLAGLPMRFDDLAAEPARLSPADLQRLALLHRLDLRAALARHAAADAALRVELARQWPEIVLKPGYAWDQGDNRWSLGVALNLPPGGDNRASIEQARARRNLEAARVAELQQAALARLEVARHGAQAALMQLEMAEAALRDAREHDARTQRRLEAGDVDRVERLTARLVEQDALRRFAEARTSRWSALGELEDALQRPLDEQAAPARQARLDAGRAISYPEPTPK
jgi:outer membrane protein TolC